jgi:hypothetical protein
MTRAVLRPAAAAPVEPVGPRPSPAPGPLVRALRRALPALVGYALVRLVGLAVLGLSADGLPVGLLTGRYDSGWYLKIAASGYAETCAGVQGELCRYAFFPLYPALIRLVGGCLGVFGVPLYAAAWAVALAASLAAAWGVYAVAARVAGHRAGVITAVLWGLVPHAVVESMAYTEPLFTALAAWALHSVLAGRWRTAAVLAVLAGLCRPTGAAVAAAVVAAALWEAARRGRAGAAPDGGRHREPAGGRAGHVDRAGAGRPAGRSGPGRWPGLPRPAAGVSRTASAAVAGAVPAEGRRAGGAGRPGAGRLVTAVLVAPLGWLFWIGWVGHRAGRWDGWFAVQERWNSTFDGGFFTVRRMTGVFLVEGAGGPVPLVITGTLLAAVTLLAVCCLQRQPLPLLVYGWAVVVLAVGGDGYFHSKARFLIPAFVLLIPVAGVLARSRTRVAATVLAAVSLVSALYGSHVLLVAGHSP